MLLKQIDNSGPGDKDENEIELIFDEFTTQINIGRGTLLKIKDTKIAKQHAQIIKINTGHTYELSTANTGKTCYYKLKGDDEWTLVQSKVELKNESYFSLMPEKYIFQVMWWEER